MTRGTETAGMTPHARLAQLHRELADAYEQLASDQSTEWVDQQHSPLGRRRHCALVRSGKLRGRRVGRQVLVQRAEIDRLIEREAQRILPRPETDDEDEAILLSIGLRKT